MLSFFGGGCDTPRTPLMACGDERSAEESKEADPSLVDTGDSEEMADPHGDAGVGGIMQAIAQTQCNDTDKTQDWDTEVWNHALVHVLDKEKLDANATNESTAFAHGQGFDDVSF